MAEAEQVAAITGCSLPEAGRLLAATGNDPASAIELHFAASGAPDGEGGSGDRDGDVDGGDGGGDDVGGDDRGGDHGRGEQRMDLSSPGGVEQFTSGILDRAKDRGTDDGGGGGGGGGGGFSSFSGQGRTAGEAGGESEGKAGGSGGGSSSHSRADPNMLPMTVTIFMYKDGFVGIVKENPHAAKKKHRRRTGVATCNDDEDDGPETGEGQGQARGRYDDPAQAEFLRCLNGSLIPPPFRLTDGQGR